MRNNLLDNGVDSEVDSQTYCCPICYDDNFSDNENDPSCRYTTSCGHIFHTSCINRWYLNSNTCPCCRTEVFERQLTSIDPSLNNFTFNENTIIYQEIMNNINIIYNNAINNNLINNNLINDNSINHNDLSNNSINDNDLRINIIREFINSNINNNVDNRITERVSNHFIYNIELGD